MEKNMKNNVYINICVTESLLYNRNEHNIMNQEYFNKIKF